MQAQTHLQEVPAFRLVHDETEAARCFPLMHQLRPKLVDERDFCMRWLRQLKTGYHLAALWLHGKPVALAGYRYTENLIHDFHMYVDDLVTDSGARSKGYGKSIFSHLKEEALANGCEQLVLDASLSNTSGHRFYIREGLLTVGLHFTTSLK